MSDCERCQSLLDLYIDHELSESEHLFVEKHLAQCSECQAQWQTAQELEGLLSQWAAEEIEPPSDFREKLFARLENEPAPIVPLAPRAQKKKPSLSRLLPWAAAAVLLLALMPAVMHVADSRSDKADTANQSPLIANNDLGEAEDMDNSAEPEAAPAEPAPPSNEQTQSSQPLKEKDRVVSHQAAVIPENAEQNQADNSQPDLKAPTPDDRVSGTGGEQTPMLASGYSLDSEQMPAEGDQSQPPIMMYRSAPMGEVDWEVLKEQDTSLKQQYSAELEQLKEQYDQEPSDELAQAIADKEKELEEIEKRLKAIEDKDAEAYAALEE